MATTAFCYSAKQELLQGGHCFNGPQSALTGAGVSGQFTLTGLASTAGLTSGMAAAATNVAAGAVIATIDSASQVTLSKAHTGTVTNGISFTADAFKMLLIKAAPGRTFDGTQTNVGTPGSGGPTAANVGTDETSGTGYTTGGFALTNVTPSIASTTTAITTFSANPSWTSASFSATAAVIYNNTATRQGAAAAPLGGRAISVHDFGGTQTVSSGTFTVVLPTADASNAILRIT